MLDVLSTLQDGFSPLSMAAQEGHLDVCRLLIEQGANVNSQSKVCMPLKIYSVKIYRVKAQNKSSFSASTKYPSSCSLVENLFCM